jgi:tetratricopeptide (TPR) repeat protein
LILWLQKKSVNWRRLLEIAPFVALGIGMGLVTIWWERYHQGTRGEAFALGWTDRILVASRALWFYLGKLLWPTHLSFSYPKWPISAANPLNYIWLLATVGAGAAIYFMRRYLGRSVEVAMVFFVATLSPVLGFIMLYTFRFSFVADHYQYLASIGPLALAASGITVAIGPAEKRKRFLMPMICAGLLLSLGALTWRQCAMYANEETLWQKTIAENPDSWMAYTNLGAALLRTGRTEDAITQFKKAVEIHDDYAMAHNNLGNALLRLGRVEESLAHLQKALEINPNYAEAQNNLGNTLVQMNRWEEAAAHYTRALELDPRYAEAHNNIGALFLQLGRVTDSFIHLQKALEIDPDQSDAHSNLGNTLLKMGRMDEAIAHYDRALEINPSNINAQNNLAWLLATSAEPRIRNGPRAVELAERADRLTRSGNAVISATLAAAYAETGRFADAVRIAERALQLATNSNNPALADGIRQQIELYRSNSPSRENRSAPAAP